MNLPVRNMIASKSFSRALSLWPSHCHVFVNKSTEYHSVYQQPQRQGQQGGGQATATRSFCHLWQNHRYRGFKKPENEGSGIPCLRRPCQRDFSDASMWGHDLLWQTTRKFFSASSPSFHFFFSPSHLAYRLCENKVIRNSSKWRSQLCATNRVEFFCQIKTTER